VDPQLVQEFLGKEKSVALTGAQNMGPSRLYHNQGRIYTQAKGARAQGGKLKKIEIEVWYAGEKKAVLE
jgi:hypothetical protein